MRKRPKFKLRLPSRALILGERTLLMGVLNVTPDSFSDGGKFLDPQQAVDHALEMERQGADLLGLGGETPRRRSRRALGEKEISRVACLYWRVRGVVKIPIS